MTVRTSWRWAAGGTCLAVVSYLAYAGYAWTSFGKVRRAGRASEQDALLDQFMPACDVAERHHIRIAAPADITFEAATSMDLRQSRIIRAIFKGREWLMRSGQTRPPAPGSFIDQMRAIGWGVLAEVPGREIVMGAVCQPWLGDVVFRPLRPETFAEFREPEYVKIVWTLRADPIGPDESVFSTETRAVATDSVARSKFRRYWAFVSPGIILIRWLSLAPLKAAAERQARQLRARRVSV